MSNLTFLHSAVHSCSWQWRLSTSAWGKMARTAADTSIAAPKGWFWYEPDPVPDRGFAYAERSRRTLPSVHG